MRQNFLALVISLFAMTLSPVWAASSPVDTIAPLHNNYLANGAIGVFERNTNCWAYGIDLSCAAVWNSASANRHLATLVSPRHVLGAWHAKPQVNSRYVFQAQDGSVFTNKLQSLAGNETNDLVVCLLENAMPPQFHPAKILPSDYTNYIGTAVGLPVLSFDLKGKALVREIADMEWHFIQPPYDSINVRFRSPKIGGRVSLYENLEIGDSGRPVFFVVGNEVVLLGVWWHGGAGDVPALHHHAVEIQNLMDALCPGYALSFLNLTSFAPLSVEPVP